MQCPKCHETDHASDAIFCHMCGHQLRRKINGWMITSFILFVLMCILLGVLLNTLKEYPMTQDYSVKVENSNNIDSHLTTHQKDEQIARLKSQVNMYQSTISSLNNEISNLKRNAATSSASSTKAELNYLKNRITELEKKIVEKDREIEALRGEL